MRKGSWAAFMTKPMASRAVPPQTTQPGSRKSWVRYCMAPEVKGVAGPSTQTPTKMKPAPSTLKKKYLKASRSDALSPSWAMAM